MYKPTHHEIQSGSSRVKHAEGLILQLPEDHDGRNTWLLNYGVGDEAKALRKKHNIGWVRETEAAQTFSR
ncbi:hypothetical protein [Oceanicola sp. S124]|uniref:hypothetical protein n=1 Tax=Oceanicola sp. S124 TaxID=1042378 RepID=UPI000A05B039|nr:hypothetical protein [Oceanicola sp. S124]